MTADEKSIIEEMIVGLHENKIRAAKGACLCVAGTFHRREMALRKLLEECERKM